MKIATARTKTSKKWRTFTISWEEFLDKLRDPIRTGETMREYKSMTKAERDIAKEAAGGFVGGALTCGQRKTEFVKERYLITLDADDAVPRQWESVTLLRDFRMACYPTHSSTEDQPRLRWVIPTDRPMSPEEYPAVSRKVAEWIGIETIDPTTHDLARLFFFPSVPKDAPYELKEQDGDLLCVDEILAEYGDNEAWKDASLWPIAKKEREVRIRAIKKAGDPTEKKGIVGLFCRTFDVEDVIEQFIPEVYTPCNQEGRYTFAGGSTFGGAIVYDEGRFLYSNHSTDPCCGMSVNAFDLLRIHKYGAMDEDAEDDTPVTKLPSYKEMTKWALSIPEVRAQGVEEDMARIEEEFGDLVGSEAEESKSKDSYAWKAQVTRDANDETDETIHNAVLFLRNLPAFKDKLGYNPMSDVITVKGDLPWWTKKSKERLSEVFAGFESDDEIYDNSSSLGGVNSENEQLSPWEEVDWSNLYSYMEELGFKTRGKTNGILDHAMQIVSRENTYHPIREYLKRLEWDGVPRLDTMFIRWLGAEDDRLNREITRLWMMAGVDRVMRPGCQFDSIIITCGPQGLGKTRMLRALAKGFFTNAIDKLSVCKESSEKLQGVWIVELGELDGMRKGEVTSTKNFITSTSDRYRSAYAREAKDHPRQCIFAGTSNESSFLRDSTGERRFWIMPVRGRGDNGELVGFNDEVDQLWAEAYHEWHKRMRQMKTPGVPWEKIELMLYLKDPELDRQMKLRQAMFKMPEEDRDSVEDYLDALRPENWYDLDASIRRDFAQNIWLGDRDKCALQIDRISVKELRCELFGESPEDAGRRSSRGLRLTDIMDTMPGWRKAGRERIKGYPGSKPQTWVRIGSEEDKKG